MNKIQQKFLMLSTDIVVALRGSEFPDDEIWREWQESFESLILEMQGSDSIPKAIAYGIQVIGDNIIGAKHYVTSQHMEKLAQMQSFCERKIEALYSDGVTDV